MENQEKVQAPVVFRRRISRPLPARTSEVLHELAYGDGVRITFKDILLGLRHRVFGFTMLVFALPCVLPMPPGIPTVCGIVLALIALNLIMGRRRLWLPRAIAEKSIAREDLRRIVDRALPHLQRLERVCRPRLAIVTEPVGKVFIGLVVLVLGVLLILPIPFLGNIPPAAATAVIAIGVSERDGVVVLIGLLGAVVAIAVASAATWAAILGLLKLF
ncbi:MAG TPA: exopolysaccharide biosynthesis protein [Gammaproteobacteria bacterium]|nr:exopolysaccharide biosynthesis protein [Gammaproteobacteria bacterium]